MKTRFLLVIVMLVGMIGWGGCTAESTSAVAGVVGLTGVERILEDLEGITDREKTLLLAQRLELLDELAIAKTDAQREKLEAQIKANDNMELAVSVANDSVGLAKQAKETNWAEPEDVALLGSTAFATLIGYLYRKSGKKKDIRLDANRTEINKLRNGNKT